MAPTPKALTYVSLFLAIFFPSFVLNLYGKYSNKEKFVAFLQCQLSLTQFPVSFVHRHSKVEKVSVQYIERCAALVLRDFYPSISFIDELSVTVSKSPTYKYSLVQYCVFTSCCQIKANLAPFMIGKCHQDVTQYRLA